MIKRTGASASTWHSMPSVMGPTDSPLVLYMPAKRCYLPRGPRNTSQVPVSVLLSVWLPPPGSPFSSSLVQIKCHLLCEACLDPSRGDPCFVSTPTPLALRSIWLFYLISGLPDVHAPSHAPSFLEHSAAWEGLLYPCSSRAQRLCLLFMPHPRSWQGGC